jgi:hypothetical protein
MTNYEANGILDAVKAGLGKAFTDHQINVALLKTGDLDVFRSKEQPNRTLCTDGFESCSDRPCKVHDQTAARMRLELVGRYWAANKNADR